MVSPASLRGAAAGVRSVLGCDAPILCSELESAATEIERLTADNEKMRAILLNTAMAMGSYTPEYREWLASNEQRVTPDPNKPVTDPFQHQRR